MFITIRVAALKPPKNVLAFRNPRAHDLTPDTPEYALECISFLSMLAKRPDTATRR